MINVMCAFEETQQSDAKKKGGETLVRSSYTGWYDRGGREKKSLTSQVKTSVHDQKSRSKIDR